MRMAKGPSVVFGFQRARVLDRLVVTVWVVSVAVFVPVRLVVWSALWPTMTKLPDGPLPDGEGLLIVIELLRPVWLPAAAALLSGWLALWAWTVLWHAGVVRWQVLSGRGGVRLTEILGRGLLGWWPWARLGMTAVVVAFLANTMIWSSTWLIVDGATRNGHEGRAVVFLLLGLVLSMGVVVLDWMATLRASWLLGIGDRRSAVLSWVAGLLGSLRQPLRSIETLLAWAVPGALLVALPLVLSAGVEVFQGGVASAVVGIVTGLLAAFCWVGLFLSFAPVTGLVGNEHPKEP